VIFALTAQNAEHLSPLSEEENCLAGILQMTVFAYC